VRPPRATGRIERGSAFSASMYRDLDAGLHAEGDQVVDDILRGPVRIESPPRFCPPRLIICRFMSAACGPVSFAVPRTK
jgi:hypothetical protein